MIGRIDRILDWWSRALLALAILAAAAMMVHVGIDVVSRTALNAPLRQTNQTVAGYYMIAVAFLPIAFLGKADNHISADVFTEYMGPRLRRGLEVFTTVLGILYMAVFSWQSYVSAVRRTLQGEVLEISGGYMYVWPGRWILPVAAFSLLLCLTLRLVRLLLPGGSALQHPAPLHDA